MKIQKPEKKDIIKEKNIINGQTDRVSYRTVVSDHKKQSKKNKDIINEKITKHFNIYI